MGLKTEDLLKVIHKHCLKCAGSEEDVANCTANKDTTLYCACLLYPYRLGTYEPPKRSRKVRSNE